MKVIWAPFALERVTEIALYIANDNPIAAEKWIDSIFKAVLRLEDFPESGRIVPEIQRKEYREIIFVNYRIIYRIHERQIRVLTVQHEKQILPREDLSEK